MKSDEARIADAVAALRARLDARGLPDAAELAHDFVTDMLRHGWRPRALPVEEPTMNGRRVPADDARVCWCALNPSRCRIHADSTGGNP